MEDNKSFFKIQNSIEEYEKMIEIFIKENNIDFSIMVLKGFNICNSILEFILLKKDIKIDLGVIIEKEEKDLRIPFISYCTQVDKKIVPKECLEFLKIIKVSRNKAAHACEIDKKTFIEFSKALYYFSIWFNEEYVNNPVIYKKLNDINGLLFVLDEKISKESESIVKTNDDILKNILEECSKKDRKSISMDEIYFEIKKEFEKNDNYREMILKCLDKHTEEFKKLVESSKNIEKKLDEIDRQIKELMNQINLYQSLVDRQIKTALSEFEIDRIIKGYIDECAIRITNEMNLNFVKKDIEIEHKKIVLSIGEDAWNKLNEDSKKFLISAKLMYNNLLCLENQIDYSGVCILITKSLEIELTKRFYLNFLMYLDEKYKKDYSKYHSALLFRKKEPLKIENFTMGNVAYVMCHFENKNDSIDQKNINRKRLMEYSKDRLFSNKKESEIKIMMDRFAREIEKIRKKYRNPSAHTNKIKQIDAENCINLVIDVEKLLKNMLDAFKE